MSKNAKRELKVIQEKHKNDPMKRPGVVEKPVCKMVPLLNLDKCLTYAIQKRVIKDSDANDILEYMKGICVESGYWDMHWMDIEEENGMESGQAKSFKAFYELFKEYEIEDGTFPHLHFDVGVYT